MRRATRRAAKEFFPKDSQRWSASAFRSTGRKAAHFAEFALLAKEIWQKRRFQIVAVSACGESSCTANSFAQRNKTASRFCGTLRLPPSKKTKSASAKNFSPRTGSSARMDFVRKCGAGRGSFRADRRNYDLHSGSILLARRGRI